MIDFKILIERPDNLYSESSDPTTTLKTFLSLLILPPALKQFKYLLS